MNIRPVSDLRNNYSDVEQQVNGSGPVFLTKNGYGSMVVMSIDQYESLIDSIDSALEEAESQAQSCATRYTHTEVFESIRKDLHREQQAI